MMFTSPHPDVAIPDVPLTDLVLQNAARLADKPALIDGPNGRVTTYGQLAEAIRRTAAGLAARGFGKGDTLAIYSPNVPEYAVAFHAAVSLGGVVTTISPLYTVEELVFQLKDAGASLLLTVPPFLDKALDGAKQAGVREVFVFGEAAGATPFAALTETGGEPPRVAIAPDDVAALPYSSGTTGFPKGVMLTHRNLVANVTQFAALGVTREQDTLLAVLPYFHIYGMQVIMNVGLHMGATQVTMPRFDLEQFLQLMAKHRVSVGYLVPPIVLALAKHPLVDGHDLSALRVIFSGAAPLGANVAQEVSDRLGCTVMQGYGLTETSPVSHSSTLERNRQGAVGNLLPLTEGKVIDPDGRELGPDEDGEILIRGPQVMKGYLNRPDATSQTIDAEGWLHTGDVGHADADGYFFIVDRVKELIKYKGLQVAPAELEARLLAHPAVADAAVIPIPDEEAGEVPKAFVVLKAQAQATPEELMAHVAEHVAPYKRIRRVEVVEQIPKSASGKILRRLLVQREREQAAAAT